MQLAPEVISDTVMLSSSGIGKSRRRGSRFGFNRRLGNGYRPKLDEDRRFIVVEVARSFLVAGMPDVNLVVAIPGHLHVPLPRPYDVGK